MTKRRVVIAAIALAGAVLGALLGFLVAPQSSRYTMSADVALLPAPNLTTAEASNFWEVLTRGQITRTAAIVYADQRWLPSAAKAANVPQSDLTLTAAALPETTVLTVTVTGPSSAATESALNDVLATATREASSISAPFLVKVLFPQQGSATKVAVPGRKQVAAAGFVAGLLAGGGIGWFVTRRRSSPAAPVEHSPALADDDTLAR